MTNQQRISVEKIITDCLSKKLRNYKPKNNYMPFNYSLLGRYRLASYSFIQSLVTTFGTSVFEIIAELLAKENFAVVKRGHVVGKELFSDCDAAINNIINRLKIDKNPNRTNELPILRGSLKGGKKKCKTTLADLFLVDRDGVQWIFDIKTPKPNRGEIEGFKRTLLTWSGIAMTENPDVDVRAMIAITYNPNHPKPYTSWQMGGMLGRDEFLVGEEFWDFLGGEGAYEELLGCFSRVGDAMRGEIEEYFNRFKI